MKLHRTSKLPRTLDFEAVAESVYQEMLPELDPSDSAFAWSCCPFHDDSNPSFCVNLDTGWYRCFSSSCGEAGSNIVSFVGALLGLEWREAREYVENNYS